MNWQQWALSLIFFIFIVLISIGLYNDWQTFRDSRATSRDLEAQLLDYKDENASLEEDINFYSNPENLAKELRARFNYKYPGEKLLIIVPDN